MSFSFGTPSSAPANTGLTGGFNFGANKPATPGFGLAATSQPATSAPAFGSTPGFGAGTGFGTTTPAFGSTTPAFGAVTATPAFGATSTPAFGTAAPAFGSTAPPAFGATSTAPTFGATSAAPAFGATTTPAFGATSNAFGAPNPTFGSTTTATGFGSTGLGTGGINFGTGANTSTAPLGLTLGAPVTSTASTGLGGLGGFGFGSTTTAQSTGLGGFFSTSTANTSAGFFGAKLGATTVTSSLPSTSAATSFGLGGVAASGTGAANTAGDGKSEPPKETKLPKEILTTVESFKEFVKKQKSLSSDVMRVSIKPLHKVAREAESTLRAALSLSGEVSKARAHSKRLRSAAAAALANAETLSNAPGSELEGNAPPSYVKDLISELEQQLMTFKRQMDVADKQMQASPKLLTEQELTLGIRRMHESLVALAGRLQAVHTQVEAQKEQYLNLRKYVLKDPTNVFETPSASTTLDQILRDVEGTRKKTKLNHHGAVLSDPRAALGSSVHPLAGPTPFSHMGNNISAFSTSDSSVPSWQPQPQPNLNTSLNVNFSAAPAADASAFQLQKPPGKRGKQ